MRSDVRCEGVGRVVELDWPGAVFGSCGIEGYEAERASLVELLPMLTQVYRALQQVCFN